jgi:hypothetical protein
MSAFLFVQLPGVVFVFSFHGHIVGGCVFLVVKCVYDTP